jgi:hypothetical protein
MYHIGGGGGRPLVFQKTKKEAAAAYWAGKITYLLAVEYAPSRGGVRPNGTPASRLRDPYDVIVNPSHAIVFERVNSWSVVDRGHDHRGREPSHVFFPLFWAFEVPTGKQDGLCHLYIIERP